MPPQAPYLFSDYSLSTNNSHEPFESTEMLDRNDKDEKTDRTTTAQNKKTAQKSSGLLSWLRLAHGRRNKQSENEPRVIHINQPHLNQKFMQNGVSTAKYNPITFLPKFLYVEFSKSANLFFLFISGIQVFDSSVCVVLHLVAHTHLKINTANTKHFTHVSLHDADTAGYRAFDHCDQGNH